MAAAASPRLRGLLARVERQIAMDASLGALATVLTDRRDMQARLDASLLAGRKEQLAILATGQTPSDDLCQKLWNRKSAADKAQLRYAMWLTGCADTPQ